MVSPYVKVWGGGEGGRGGGGGGRCIMRDVEMKNVVKHVA